MERGALLLLIFVTIFFNIFSKVLSKYIGFIIVFTFFWSVSLFRFSYKNSIVTDPLVERNCSIVLPCSIYEMLQQKKITFFTKEFFFTKGNLFPSQGFAYFFMKTVVFCGGKVVTLIVVGT